MKQLKVPPAPFDMAEWRKLPHMQRLRPLVVRWAEYGADSPSVVLIFYVIKIALYAAIGIGIIATTTPSLGGLGNFASWWSAPIVYQKAIVYTMLFEMLGLGGGTGPLTFRFLPPVAAFLHWFRPGTLRLPPWPGKVPFTKGDTRTVFDVVLFTATVASVVVLLVSHGTEVTVLGSPYGTLKPSLVVPMLVLVALMGLRDKMIYLAARGEMYWIASLTFLFPAADMMVGLKLAIAAIWLGAGVSKLTHNFPFVITAMISNSPLRPKWLKRRLYRSFPTDMRPSRLAFAMGHIGTVLEIGAPIVLLASHGGWVSWTLVAIMVVFHLHIISTIPMGVPNEWNVFMIYATLVLFGAHANIGFGDVQHPVLVWGIFVVLIAPVILGNLRPDLVSFLTSMRYYAGNWANGVWVFRKGFESKLATHITKASGLFTEQLEQIYGDKEFAELTSFRFRTFRSMHPHGRGLNGLLTRTFENLDDYVVFDGEAVSGTVLGWNFGDGHCHDERLLAAVQKRCQFEPGELTLIFMESQPIHRQRQQYRVVDAATGELEAGYISMHDMTSRQPWMDGPDTTIPVDVTSRSVPADQRYLQKRSGAASRSPA